MCRWTAWWKQMSRYYQVSNGYHDEHLDAGDAVPLQPGDVGFDTSTLGETTAATNNTALQRLTQKWVFYAPPPQALLCLTENNWPSKKLTIAQTINAKRVFGTVANPIWKP